MKLSKSEWAAHISAQKKSGQSIPEYCKSHDLKLPTFRYHSKPIRAPKPSFKEIPIRPELILTVADDRSVDIRGIDFHHLPAVIGAWSHALQK